MSAKAEAQEWAAIVSGLAAERGLHYEPIGGINPVGAPVALCPGGTNRITGELSDGFFGASCDADEHEEGGFMSKAVVPGAVLVKAHMPDLATVVPVFDVESLERTAGDTVDRFSRRRVEFESMDFNKRFIATVPQEHDPVALRELFSPGFIDWITRVPAEVDFGITDQQLFFHWRLRQRSKEELKEALRSAGGIFDRLHREMEENNLDIYRAGPWNAGLEPFPPKIGS
ncbi:MAG TPA: hypothetical protein VLB79_12165 [Solirubrobacterales bacterium]|nr:hypothetical protein [Solirubrobacterales bacterium]